MSKRIRFSLDPACPSTEPDGSSKVHYGLWEGETVYETSSLNSAERGAARPLASVRLLPPCWPSKIVCVGRNYLEHARELGNEAPPEPLIFLKPPSSMLATGDGIVYPKISQRVDHEGELGVVIGRRARHVPRERALDYVLGYTVVNDVTARDLQKKDGQWTRAKGFDTFCVAGPAIMPAAEVNLSRARIRTVLNGALRQDAPLSDMIFPVDVIVAFVTEVMTLEPGDLIATGTPPGVGPMEVGARVRVEIEGIGAIENPVVGG